MLNHALTNARNEKAADQTFEIDDLKQAIINGAGMRVRPVMMTVATIIIGLLPILYGTGTGSEIMSRIAAPMVGGMVSAVLLSLIVLPAVYFLIHKQQLKTA